MSKKYEIESCLNCPCNHKIGESKTFEKRYCGFYGVNLHYPVDFEEGSFPTWCELLGGDIILSRTLPRGRKGE